MVAEIEGCFGLKQVSNLLTGLRVFMGTQYGL